MYTYMHCFTTDYVFVYMLIDAIAIFSVQELIVMQSYLCV